MQNIFFFFSLQFRFHLPFYRQSSQVRSQVKTKHITNVRLLIQLLAVSFQRSVCMFTELTSLHLLQSTSITNTGLERPIYTLATVEEKRRGRKKNVFCINENYWEKILSLYSQLATALCLHVNNYINSHKISNFLS